MKFNFAHRLDSSQSKQHIPHRFQVPEQCRRVQIQHRYDPERAKGRSHLLTLTLFDPDGFRGAGHRGGGEQKIEITAESATPGYLPGPIQPGEWTLQIDTHMVLPNRSIDYQIQIDLEVGADTLSTEFQSPRPSFDGVLKAQPGWYRGDLHAHSRHSDASWDAADLVKAARTLGLDFVTLTDHNTVSSLPEIAHLRSDDLLTLGGIELTTFWGHAVCLGTTQWIDWRVDRAGSALAKIAEELYTSDRLFVMAHPKDIGDPHCTGCRWLYSELMPGPVRVIEIWNGPWAQPGRSARKNEDGLALWYRWLNEGHRLVATAGSDAHGPAHYGTSTGFNVVYAEQLSQSALLAGIAAGRLYLSSGPILQFSATADSAGEAGIGEILTVDAGDTLSLSLRWRGGVDQTSVRLVQDGDVVDMRLLGSEGEQTWDTLAVNSWFVVELRDENGTMMAVTNPIFVEMG